MVRLTVTQAMVDGLQFLDRHEQGNKLDLVESEETVPLPMLTAGKPISHVEVIELSKKLRRAMDSSEKDTASEPPACHLDDLLRGSQVYIEPPKPKPELSSGYKALMARLREDEEARAYERMINPPLASETFAQRFPYATPNVFFTDATGSTAVSGGAKDEDDDVTYADINRQIALIINILVSIVACSAALWMIASHWSTPARLALSMAGSLIVAVAEVAVYAGYLRRLTEAKVKERKKVEVKEIIKTWVIGGGEDWRGREDIVDVKLVKGKKTERNDGMRKRKPG
ncbi:hypothetical protein MMC25_005556 [Agyrium rufum]|nr:hypothetical protein [Agyrium rufum]